MISRCHLSNGSNPAIRPRSPKPYPQPANLPIPAGWNEPCKSVCIRGEGLTGSYFGNSCTPVINRIDAQRVIAAVDRRWIGVPATQIRYCCRPHSGTARDDFARHASHGDNSKCTRTCDRTLVTEAPAFLRLESAYHEDPGRPGTDDGRSESRPPQSLHPYLEDAASRQLESVRVN